MLPRPLLRAVGLRPARRAARLDRLPTTAVSSRLPLLNASRWRAVGCGIACFSGAAAGLSEHVLPAAKSFDDFSEPFGGSCWRTVGIGAVAAAVVGAAAKQVYSLAKERADVVRKEELGFKVDLTKLEIPDGHVVLDKALLAAGFTGKGHFLYRKPDESTPEAVPKWAYAGDYVNGRRSGVGTMRAASGASYYGQWVDNLYSGKGALSYPDGDQYEGSFERGAFHGHGQYFGAEGWTYRGMWVRGQQQGYGSYAGMDTSSSYDGEWEDGQRHGKGVMHFGMSNVLTGDRGCVLDCGWAEGLPDGKASLSLPSGATARGTVQHGVWDGDVKVTPLAVAAADGGQGGGADGGSSIVRESYWKGRRVIEPGDAPVSRPSEAARTLTLAMQILANAV